MADRLFFEMYCFERNDFIKIEETSGTSHRTHTRKNRYSIHPFITTAVFLRRLSTPARWCDIEHIFYR